VPETYAGPARKGVALPAEPCKLVPGFFKAPASVIQRLAFNLRPFERKR